MKDKVLASLWGLIVGDALGVPAEFKSRAELVSNPIQNMTGYGTHNQPPGTWSDDSSMMLATVEWLNENKNNLENTYHVLMDKFLAWLMYGDYTPYEETFDSGITVSRALMNYGRGMAPIECGGRTEYENGNGSLMRILPISLMLSQSLAEMDEKSVRFIFDMSALTHAHTRSKAACLIYSAIVSELVSRDAKEKESSVRDAAKRVYEYIQKRIADEGVKSEISTFDRIWNISDFINTGESSIKSSGYVVDTLEAAVWCLLTTDSYRECVLKAVNLGGDTDTVAAVAGGLAGACYGMNQIPQDWLEALPKREWIGELLTVFVSNCLP